MIPVVLFPPHRFFNIPAAASRVVAAIPPLARDRGRADPHPRAWSVRPEHPFKVLRRQHYAAAPPRGSFHGYSRSAGCSTVRLGRRGRANATRPWPTFAEEPMVLSVAQRRQRGRRRIRRSCIRREAYARNLWGPEVQSIRSSRCMASRTSWQTRQGLGSRPEHRHRARFRISARSAKVRTGRESARSGGSTQTWWTSDGRNESPRILQTTSPDKSGMASGDGGNDHPEVIFDSHDPSHRQ